LGTCAVDESSGPDPSVPVAQVPKDTAAAYGVLILAGGTFSDRTLVTLRALNAHGIWVSKGGKWCRGALSEIRMIERSPQVRRLWHA
jgi:hypothetical protein